MEGPEGVLSREMPLLPNPTASWMNGYLSTMTEEAPGTRGTWGNTFLHPGTQKGFSEEVTVDHGQGGGIQREGGALTKGTEVQTDKLP